MTEEECFFDFVKFELVCNNLIVVFLGLEEVLVVLLLHTSLLLHHASSASHKLHLFDRLLVGKHHSHDTVESVNEEEGP